MTLIHHRDRALASIIKPNLEHGPWIAGGAALRWYQNLPVGKHDIDVFVNNSEQLATLNIRILDELHGHKIFDSEFAVTYGCFFDNNEYKIQLIKRHFASLEACLNNFDLTVCTIATDGDTWVKGQYFDRDLATRSIVFQNGITKDCIKRVVKYSIYGYEASAELLDEIYNDDQLQVEFKDDDDYRM